MRTTAAILLGVLTGTGCATSGSHGIPGGTEQSNDAQPSNTSGRLEDIGEARERALALWREDKHTEACQLLRRAIAQSPDDVELRLTLARVLMDDNQLDDASSELDEVTRRRPQLATPYVLSGYVRHRRGDLPEAEQAFRAALLRVGEGRERIAAHLGLGAVLEQTDRQAEADGQYSAAIALAPELRGVLMDIQKQRLLPPPVAMATGLGEVSPSARLREMEKILRKMDEQK